MDLARAFRDHNAIERLPAFSAGSRGVDENLLARALIGLEDLHVRSYMHTRYERQHLAPDDTRGSIRPPRALLGWACSPRHCALERPHLRRSRRGA
jgi:hypothetical protein